MNSGTEPKYSQALAGKWLSAKVKGDPGFKTES